MNEGIPLTPPTTGEVRPERHFQGLRVQHPGGSGCRALFAKPDFLHQRGEPRLALQTIIDRLGGELNP